MRTVRRTMLIAIAVLLIIPLAMGLLILSGCGGDGGGTGPGDGGKAEEIKQAAALQESTYAVLTDLLAVMDTSAALDSVVRVFRADALVESAGTNSQGIYVEYTSGTRGGIILDYREDSLGTTPALEIAQRPAGGFPRLATEVVPADERTVILNPHYLDRENYTRDILDCYDALLPTVGFLEPERYFLQECTLNKYTFLEHYGIIHFYSHGWAWPWEHNIQTVYLMTGEEVNDATTNLFWRDICSGDVPLVIGEHGHKYFVSPDFIAAYNDFSPDTTLIYGGFCYSSLGGWPATMIAAGAAGYFGFDWSVRTNWNAYWARAIISYMADTLYLHPLTVGQWIYYTPKVPKVYEDETAPYGTVALLYNGNSNLALYHDRVEIDLTSMNEVWIDLMVDIDWTCDRTNLMLHRLVRPVSITSRVYEQEWQYWRVFTGSIDVYDSGRLYLQFNRAFTRIDTFFVTNTWYFDAEEEELNQYGYPELKTQIFTGGHVPIWVTNPDIGPHIYGVPGSDAADHVSDVTCDFSFPDGSSCSINSYTFTDEPLQMIRFNFHTK
jgi:hypothetical protein